MAHLTHLRQRYTEKIESSRENRVGGGEQSILQTSKHAHYYILQQTSIQIARPSLSLLSSGNCALPEKTRSLLLKLMRIPPVLCGTFDMRLLTNNGVSDLLLFKEAVSNGHKGSLFHIAFSIEENRQILCNYYFRPPRAIRGRRTSTIVITAQ